MLWEIGQRDTNTAEFALAPNNYGQLLSENLFIVGKSEPGRNWPYVHPGPEDAWGGSHKHTYHIAFGLKKVPQHFINHPLELRSQFKGKIHDSYYNNPVAGYGCLAP